jgi:hypothetical protein
LYDIAAGNAGAELNLGDVDGAVVDRGRDALVTRRQVPAHQGIAG